MSKVQNFDVYIYYVPKIVFILANSLCCTRRQSPAKHSTTASLISELITTVVKHGFNVLQHQLFMLNSTDYEIHPADNSTIVGILTFMSRINTTI